MKLKFLSPALFILAAACSAETPANASTAEEPPQATDETNTSSPVTPEPTSVDIPSGVYTNDPTHTSLIWRINHLGLSNYAARMNDVKITLDFNAEDFSQSSVTAVIDPQSVDTGYPGEEDFDAKIADSEDFFNAGAFPAIEFTSKTITLTGAETATITGDLTMLGVTKEITLDAVYSGSVAEHFFAKKPAIGFSAKGAINRTDFGLDYLSGRGLGDEVEIVITAEFLQQ